MTSNFLKGILSVLSFYAIFEFPLTREEIWQNLLFYKECNEDFSPKDLDYKLEELLNLSLINEKNGLYALFPIKDDFHYLNKRREFYLHYYLKLEKAQKWARRLALFPGVRMVALVNSVAMKMPKKDSDLDFFIMTDKNSLWISRFLVTAFLKVFGLRPNFVDDTDAICTSFWLSEKNMNLSGIKSRYFDVYLFNWLYNIIPLYDAADYYGNFQKANKWKKRFLPNANDEAYLPLLNYLGFFARAFKKILEFIFLRKIWHKFFKKLQLKYFSKEIKRLMNKDSRVVVNDEILKFHTIDNREIYWKKYKENFDNLINKYRYVSKS